MSNVTLITFLSIKNKQKNNKTPQYLYLGKHWLLMQEMVEK